jgi:hypothetical protein
MRYPPDVPAEELARAREMERVPDLIAVPVIAGILARCLLHSEGCTIDDEDRRGRALSRSRDVARLAEGHPLWRKSPDHAHALVLRLVEHDVTELQPWNAGGLAYYALDLASGIPETPAGFVERFRRWHELRQPSLLETVLLAMDCAGRVARTPGLSTHLLGRAAKPLRLALIEPYQSRLAGSWQKALAWSYSEYSLFSLSYFVLNLASTSTALGYKLNDVADLVRRACTERDEALAGRDMLEHEEVERRAEARASERIREAEARISEAEAARDRAMDELRALYEERDRLAGRLAGALSRIESVESQLAASAPPAPARAASEPAPAGDPTSPAEPVTPPTLAGQRVLVFTNQQRAGVREEIRTTFVELGAAQVDVIDASRSHGPDAYPPDAIVVADITFMAHADFDAVKTRAARAGCRFVPLRAGSATLAERTAAWAAGAPPRT